MAILMYCILLAFMLSGSHASNITVPWKVPNETDTKAYDEWACLNRFQVGDSLVFDYSSSEDSVLQVTPQDYRNCNTSHPIATINRVFKLPHSGPFYFISGASGHCEKYQKLHVVVLAIRSVTPPSPPQFPPVPAPAPVLPAPAPVVPAPAPVVPAPVPAPSPSPSMVPAVPPTSTAVPAAPVLQSAGYMCVLLISGWVFIL